MESVREGRRQRQPGLVHDNDNVRAPIFQRHEAENTRVPQHRDWTTSCPGIKYRLMKLSCATVKII